MARHGLAMGAGRPLRSLSHDTALEVSTTPVWRTPPRNRNWSTAGDPEGGPSSRRAGAYGRRHSGIPSGRAYGRAIGSQRGCAPDRAWGDPRPARAWSCVHDLRRDLRRSRCCLYRGRNRQGHPAACSSAFLNIAAEPACWDIWPAGYRGACNASFWGSLRPRRRTRRVTPTVRVLGITSLLSRRCLGRCGCR